AAQQGNQGHGLREPVKLTDRWTHGRTRGRWPRVLLVEWSDDPLSSSRRVGRAGHYTGGVGAGRLGLSAIIGVADGEPDLVVLLRRGHDERVGGSTVSGCTGDVGPSAAIGALLPGVNATRLFQNAFGAVGVLQLLADPQNVTNTRISRCDRQPRGCIIDVRHLFRCVGGNLLVD